MRLKSNCHQCYKMTLIVLTIKVTNRTKCGSAAVSRFINVISEFYSVTSTSNTVNRQGEVTSQSLWSQNDRHFVGIT